MLLLGSWVWYYASAESLARIHNNISGCYNSGQNLGRVITSIGKQCFSIYLTRRPPGRYAAFRPNNPYCHQLKVLSILVSFFLSLIWLLSNVYPYMTFKFFYSESCIALVALIRFFPCVFCHMKWSITLSISVKDLSHWLHL